MKQPVQRDELFCMLDGSVEYYCGTERFIAGAEDYVFVPQGAPHTMRYVTPPCGW